MAVLKLHEDHEESESEYVDKEQFETLFVLLGLLSEHQINIEC